MELSRFEYRLSIALGALFVLNALVLIFLGLAGSLPGWEITLVILFLWNIILWGIFWKFRAYQVDWNGRPLQKLGIPNFLGLIRLTFLPTVVFLFLLAQDRRELVVFTFAAMSVLFLTDFLDGYLARKYSLGSQFGQILDSSSDYVLLLTLTGLFIFCGILPLWLVIIILIRLLFQAIGSFWVRWKHKKYLLENTFLGKLSLAALMFLYALKILVFLQLTWLSPAVILGMEIVTSVLMILSLLDKILFFRRNL